MNSQPKTEPASPPIPISSSRHGSLNGMSFSELVSDFRASYDKFEEVLVAKHKAEIDSLAVKYELERLQRVHTEDQLKKKEQQLLDDSNAIAALRIRCCELEEENKKNLETIQKLKDGKSRLKNEKCNADAAAKVLKKMPCESSDVNRLNEKMHIAGALDFEVPRMLELRRGSVLVRPPLAILSYVQDAGFEGPLSMRDFDIDSPLLSSFVERWRPETHSFHLPHGEATITLQDVAYHLGLRTDGDPVGGCVRDFQQHYGRSMWQMVEDLLGERPPMRGGKNEYAAIKLSWLRDRVQRTPSQGTPDVLRQHARCYILLMIGCWLFPDKSDNMVSVRWVPLLEDFDCCKKLSWGSAVLSYTYHCLCRASDRGTINISGCIPLIMSWIYQRFPRWCPYARNTVVFPLVSRLNGLQQHNSDTHKRRMLSTRLDLDKLRLNEFVCTPYDDPSWDALLPAWMHEEGEQKTWRAVVPIVCFMYVRMHHVDRVKKQLGGEQHIPNDPVNLDGLLYVSARGEDQWWPTKHEQWYSDWKARFEDERQVAVTHTPYPGIPTQEYFDWWQRSCRVRYLSPQDALDDPRLDNLPDDVPMTVSQPRDSLALPADVPITRRRAREYRPDIRRQARRRRLDWAVQHHPDISSPPTIMGLPSTADRLQGFSSISDLSASTSANVSAYSSPNSC